MSSFLTPEQIEQLKRSPMAKPAVMPRGWHNPNAQKNLLKQMGLKPIELSPDKLAQLGKPIGMSPSQLREINEKYHMNQPLAPKSA